MPAKRLLTAALALLLAVSFAAPSGTQALSADGFEYTVTGSAATVTGCTSTCPTALVIPDTLGSYPVTSIGTYAFYEMGLTSLTLPNTLSSIAGYAFEGNPLTTVSIPDSVETIGIAAFYRNSLTVLQLGNSVTTIGMSAFTDNVLSSGGNSISSLTIPNSVTFIGENAFAGNVLISVTIGNSVEIIGDSAFAVNDLISVTIPNSVESIGDDAFAYNALTSLTIGNSVTSIGDLAFYENALTSVIIPNSVTSIGNYAFEANDLTSVTFLGNAPTAGDSVFLGNSGLSSVTRSSTATGWGATWSGVPVVIDELPPETTLDVTPNSTTSSLVASFEFSGSDNLSSVTFECSVDGGSYVSCASPFSTPTLSVGPHMFAVRAVDAVGNIDLTPASHTWTIESGLPPTNRDSSLWTTTLVILAGLTAAASIALRVRGAKRA